MSPALGFPVSVSLSSAPCNGPIIRVWGFYLKQASSIVFRLSSSWTASGKGKYVTSTLLLPMEAQQDPWMVAVAIASSS